MAVVKTLHCLVPSIKHMISLDVDRHSTIPELKQLIRSLMPLTDSPDCLELCVCNARKTDVLGAPWLVMGSDDHVALCSLDHAIEAQFMVPETLLKPSWHVGASFAHSPFSPRIIHVIVKVPDASLFPTRSLQARLGAQLLGVFAATAEVWAVPVWVAVVGVVTLTTFFGYIVVGLIVCHFSTITTKAILMTFLLSIYGAGAMICEYRYYERNVGFRQ